MIKYDKFRYFTFSEIDHNFTKNSDNTNIYQQYFDKLNDISGLYYLEHVRILKDFFNEKRFTIKTKIRFTKSTLVKMIKSVEKDYDILEITKNWLGEKKINDNNINDGIIEWFIKIKKKTNFNELRHIGGFYNNVDITMPTYTPEYLIRFDHNNDKKYKIPINLLLNGKMYDKIWYYSDTPNISNNEIFNYTKYYVNKLNHNIYINQIIMTYNGWLIDLWT
jgi:hypothetical protein